MRKVTSFALLTLFALACDSRPRTIVTGWAGTDAVRDTLVRGISAILGYAPDTMQWCGPSKLRLVFVDRPGELPIRHIQYSGGSTIYAPNPAVDRNSVRALAYGILAPLRATEVKTLRVTLHRAPTPRGGAGRLAQSFETDVSALRDSTWHAWDPVPVSVVSSGDWCNRDSAAPRGI